MKNLSAYLMASASFIVLLNSSDVFAQETQDVISVSQKSRPSYEALGTRVGSFEVRPSIGVKEVFDDNIFKTENDEIEDIITIVSPTLNIQSNWNNHFLSIDAKADVARYADSDAEDYEDMTLDVYGRYDVLRDTFLDAGVKLEQLHEDRGSVDDTNGAKPTEYSVFTGQTGFSRKLRKISLEVDGEAKNYDFENTNGRDNSGRDRTHYKGTTRVGYEIFPNYEAFISASYEVRSYGNTSVTDRDSDGYDVVAGTAVDISGKVKGSLYVGYMERSIDDASLADIDDIRFGGDLIWNPTGITSVIAGVDRSIEETSIAASSGYVATRSSLKVEHELKNNFILDANLSFTNNEYEGGAGLQRDDDVLSAGVGAEYYLNRNIRVSAGYDYSQRESNVAGSDYVDNQVMVRLTLLH